MATAYVALGSNMPPEHEHLNFALAHLPGVEAVSPRYVTAPWGNTDQPAFVNACLRLHTQLTPHALLALLLDIEQRAGRERGERWGPRTLDLDLLAYDRLQLHDDDLQLPHPRIGERAFVLIPLRDLTDDGSLFGLPTLCDEWLGENEIINFNAGDHGISVSMRYADYVLAEKPELGTFAE